MLISYKMLAGVMVLAGLTLVGGGTAAPATVDLSLLAVGKTRSGLLYNIKQSKKFPVSQKVSLRVESVTGSSAKIFISWSKPSSDTGNPGSGSFVAQISEKEGQPKLTCETENGKKKWSFVFQKDGTVNCYMDIPAKMVSRWGDLQ
jgi:hypothetical protein